MSGTFPNDGNGQEQGIYGAAKDAIGSAAEKLRAGAPETYDAGVKAARYVGETASEHPVSVLAGAAVVAFFGWLLTTGHDNRPSWQKQAGNWQKRGYELNDRARSAMPDLSKAADQAGEYVYQTAREYPISGLLIAAAVGSALTYLIQGRH